MKRNGKAIVPIGTWGMWKYYAAATAFFAAMLWAYRIELRPVGSVIRHRHAKSKIDMSCIANTRRLNHRPGILVCE
ncbi:hypothetical protein MnTg02_00260 [bacterium MnTg02]|nr:hypothetical protein MnTg02_00260 [bacterium MnTg02]